MIKFENVTLGYKDNVVLRNMSFSLPQNGFVCLCGESGSGKTTLLNSISGLIKPNSGNILIDNTNILSLKNNELSNFRFSNIGYVFQSFNLINLETVYTNVKLPLDSVSTLPSKIKKERVNDVLKSVGVFHLKNKNINTLSGGEKQRVAIARAIVSSPKIILADEPTGALDFKNSEQIYKMLKELSTKYLIICSTHDVKGTSKFADYIIEVKDDGIEVRNNNILPLNNQSEFKIDKIKNPSVSYSYKFHHSFHKLKSKRIRSLLTISMFSFSLLGLGLSYLLSNNITGKITEAFSSLSNGNNIVMSLRNKNVNPVSKIYAADKERVENIYEKYKEKVQYYGCSYEVNFEDFFKNKNEFYIASTARKISLKYLSARSINDFDLYNKTSLTYPYQIDELFNDQIILQLDQNDMKDLCYKLQIQRNFSTLGNYIVTNGLSIALSVENDYWTYDDEQLFEVKGVIQGDKTKILHLNSLWNEYVFEERMRFPTDDDKETYYPWEMYKIYYLKLGELNIQNDLFYDNSLNDYVFDLSTNDKTKLYIYYADKYSVLINDVVNLVKSNKNISNYIYITQGGYSSYASNLLSGFSNKTFLSNSIDDLDKIIDIQTSLNEDTNIVLPSNVLSGHFLATNNRFHFSTKYKSFIGNAPVFDQEILISSKIVDDLKVNIGDFLYLTNEFNGDYKIASFNVCGIVESDDYIIYQNPIWSISVFRDYFNVGSFNLIPTSVIFELDESLDANNICSSLSKQMKSYNFECASQVIVNSTKSTLDYLKTIILLFTICSGSLSIIMFSIVIYLNIKESINEIKLYKYLGVRNEEIFCIFFIETISLSLISFIISSIEVLISDYILTYSIGDAIGGIVSFSPYIVPYFINLLICICIPLIISIFTVAPTIYKINCL